MAGSEIANSLDQRVEAAGLAAMGIVHAFDVVRDGAEFLRDVAHPFGRHEVEDGEADR